jgi:hypothetical protein
MEKKLGKIESAKFGHGSYQDAMLGIHFFLSADGWGVNTSMSTWDARMIECSEYARWTEEDRSKQHDEIVRYISDLLADAKVSSIDKLVGVPIEAEFDGMELKNWRILTEVL